MSPYERILAKAAALESLGVPPSADAEEIRGAWRRAAFASHPDRAGGDHCEFLEAKDAYDLLRELSGTQNGAVVERAVSNLRKRTRAPAIGPRPKTVARTTQFPGDWQVRCQELLAKADASMSRKANGERVEYSLQPGRPYQQDEPINGHFAFAVRTKGRAMSYLVATELCKGWNRVALPTMILEDQRMFKAKILSFFTETSGPGRLSIPEAVRSEVFGGARMVTIDFATKEKERGRTSR